LQVNVKVPAQVPSVDTLAVLVGAGTVVVPVPALQVPKAELQPAPQYAVVGPHHPAPEQQFPNALVWQVNPLVPPHVPSVETFFVVVAVEVGAVFFGGEDPLDVVQARQS